MENLTVGKIEFEDMDFSAELRQIQADIARGDKTVFVILFALALTVVLIALL